MTTPRMPTPGRRNPLPDILGEPSDRVDIVALYAQFARQDRMLLTIQARAERMERAVGDINAATTKRAGELEEVLGSVPPDGPTGRRIARVAAWLRVVAADIDDPVPPDPGDRPPPQ